MSSDLSTTPVSRSSLGPETEMLVVTVGESSRAYPKQAVLDREVLNDVVAERPLVVVYCQSCGVGMSYSASQSGRVLHFAPAGMRDGAELMKDDETGSVWTQLSGSALEGELEGQSLEMYPLEVMSFGDYAERDPRGEVLAE